MVVAAVDQRDVDRLVAEEPGGEQAAEPATDDDDPVARRYFLASGSSDATTGYRPGLECMMPPSAKTVVAVR